MRSIKRKHFPRASSRKRSRSSVSIPKSHSLFTSDHSQKQHSQKFFMDVKLPQLAEGVESGTVVSILVAEGQEVKKDQAIMELETQKAVGSIPAPSSGIVTKIYVKQGMEVAVGQALIAIESSGTASAASAKPPQAPATTEAPPTKTATTAAANAAGNHCRGRGKLPLRVEKRRAATRAAVGAQDRARPWHRSNRESKAARPAAESILADLRAYVQRLQQIAFQAPRQARSPPLPPAVRLRHRAKPSISPNGGRYAGKKCRRSGARSAAGWWNRGQRSRK